MQYIKIYNKKKNGIYIYDAQKISRLNVSGFNDLKGLKRKTNNQRKPRLTSQEPSDDEVSFSLKF